MNIELFSCSGGMAEGFRRAGVHFDLAIDKSTDACVSYEANLGHKPEQCDVNDFYREIATHYPPFNRRVATVLPWRTYGAPASWSVDLMVADPPCTPWSDAGKREGLADPRDCMLVTVSVIRALMPRCYLIGNVPGLGNPSNLDIQREILRPLRAAGYCTADFRRFNAADYGVPQVRQRPFWFGHLEGTCIQWPAPTHSDPRKIGLDIGVQSWVTCADALGHLDADEIGETIQICWKPDSDHRPSNWSEPGKTQTANTHSDGALLMNDKHPPCEPGAPARTQTARAAGGHSGAQLLVWPWDRPSTTVTTKGTIGGAGRNKRTNGRSQNGVGAVKLSERARALLQGFPADWTFHGKTQKSRAGQIGMAMPPPMAEAVARAVRQQMEST